MDCSSKQCLCICKGSNTHGIANLPCVFCLLGCSPNPCEHHGTVMAVHSYRVLKERFAETRSLHRHDAEQQVWAVPNKLLQGKGLCIYKDIACKRASAYQNGTTKHCLQKLLHPSELSIPLAAVILDSISRKTSKSFWVATRWRGCLLCGPPPRQISSTVSPPPRPLYGFRAGWSLNSSTRCKHSTFI